MIMTVKLIFQNALYKSGINIRYALDKHDLNVHIIGSMDFAEAKTMIIIINGYF